ncbi:hypothetical protein ABMA27_012771 [Loxostege sticticalis]|uniref:Peptidase S1 domain-containing protein n=1 Tax=Loxostege sticticalis TaxID=481309 RepID=A0ABR3H056_LOXSC
MGLKTNSLFLVLFVGVALGQDIWGDSEETNPTEYGTTKAPSNLPITGPSCIVKGQRGTCVESRAYCKTPHTGADAVTWRSSTKDTRCPGSSICCKDSDVVPLGSSSTSTTSTTSTPSPTHTIRTSSTAPPVGCGIRNKNIFDRGNAKVTLARFGEFPWTVAVYEINDDGTETYSSVGSLIHPRVVLTIGNRFDRGGRFRIRAGDWNLVYRQERLLHQEREVESMVVHEMYNSGSGAYDVGLLFLAADVTPDKHINYACLPNSNEAPPPSTKCLASGWGRAALDQPLQQTQKMVELPVVERSSCQTKIRTGLKNEYYSLDASMMCAGGAGQDTCQGDGGAPLVCPYPGQTERYYQAGIVSWGVGCQKKGLPGVYADVAHLRDWIDRNVKAKGYTTNHYTP